MNIHFTRLISFCVVTLFVMPNLSNAKGKPVQLMADISYSRVGGYTKNNQEENTTSQFSYEFTARVEQVMLEFAPSKGEKYPSYHQLNEAQLSFRNSGTAKLKARIDSLNKRSGRKDTAQFDLIGNVKNWDDFHIKEFSSGLPLADYLASTESKLPMKGSVTNTFILMPNQTKESAVFMWPLPINYDDDSKQFLSDVSTHLLTPLLPKPKDQTMAMIYDMTLATVDLTGEIPTQGGAMIANTNASLTGLNGGWVFNTKFSRTIKSPDGNNYIETFSIAIVTVPINLPIPKQN